MNACALWKVMKSKSMNRCSLLTSKTSFFFSIRSWLMDKNLLPCFFTFFLQFFQCKTANKLFAQILLHTSSYLELDWEAETNMGIVKTTLGTKAAHGLPLIVNSWESYGSLLIWILVVAIFFFLWFSQNGGRKGMRDSSLISMLLNLTLCQFSCPFLKWRAPSIFLLTAWDSGN